MLVTTILVSMVAGCAQHEPILHLPILEVGHPTFATTLAAYAGTSIVAGNRVEILQNGDEIFPAKLRLIRAARKSITYAQYVWEDGRPSDEIVEALAERCRAGVAVNILLDAVGALSMPAQYRQRMVDAGCHVETFRPLSPWAIDKVNYRNHRRILVADGRVGITGGSGTSGKWGGNGRQEDHWRDTDVWVEGPVVEQLQGAFAENWLETTGTALGGGDYFPSSLESRGDVAAQAVRSSPAGGSAAVYTMYLLAMASAKHSICITNPYFVPDEKMIETLLGAVRRGVRVTLLLPGAIDHDLVRQASRSELGRLLEAGVRAYEYRPAMLHAKTMVVDGRWATVGSTNLDRRSFALNDEINLVVYDQAVAQRLERVFADDISRSNEITYARWNDRGFVSRFLELLSLPVRDQL
ncbi:MAG TPA: phospholipase D-like domain-containing protein [Candidatus Bathyarchaeia archaeon]|nr:phospholipase D-like domain-containing protein [Candidatus Bathyarchaeia archaeon]